MAQSRRSNGQFGFSVGGGKTKTPQSVTAPASVEFRKALTVDELTRAAIDPSLEGGQRLTRLLIADATMKAFTPWALRRRADARRELEQRHGPVQWS